VQNWTHAQLKEIITESIEESPSLSKKFDAINLRFDSLEQKVDSLSQVVADVQDIKRNMTLVLEAVVPAMRKTERIDVHETTLAYHEADIKILKTAVTSIQRKTGPTPRD
jgi:hypothetical protein